MEIRISRVPDLPEWFHLDKYAGAEALGAVDWLEQLSVRSDLFTFIPSDTTAVAKPIGLIRNRPIVDLDDDVVLSTWFWAVHYEN